jgi:uncharacterized membrane protein
MGENDFAPLPTAAYGLLLFLCGVAYTLLQAAIIAHQGPQSRLADAVGRDLKGKLSAMAYAVAIPCAFASRWIALAIYVAVSLMWLVPDRRIESRLAE